MQLILEHIIRPRAICPAAVWTASKTAHTAPPPKTQPCPQENQEDRFMSVLVGVLHPNML